MKSNFYSKLEKKSYRNGLLRGFIVATALHLKFIKITKFRFSNTAVFIEKLVRRVVTNFFGAYFKYLT